MAVVGYVIMYRVSGQGKRYEGKGVYENNLKYDSSLVGMGEMVVVGRNKGLLLLIIVDLGE
jgi:hypothetical protein